MQAMLTPDLNGECCTGAAPPDPWQCPQLSVELCTKERVSMTDISTPQHCAIEVTLLGAVAHACGSQGRCKGTVLVVQTKLVHGMHSRSKPDPMLSHFFLSRPLQASSAVRIKDAAVRSSNRSEAIMPLAIHLYWKASP